jgi:arylformamidase
MINWQTLSDADREREYSPSSCIGGNYRPHIEAYVSQSLAARSQCAALGGSWRELRYGDTANQRIDLCLPARQIASAASKPGSREKPSLLVFIHGGYWQELSAKDSLFAAAGCVERGHAFAAIDYTLAPAAGVAQIVTECRTALACLQDNADRLGFDANRVVLAGSSAGAHLAAMTAIGATPASGCARPGVRAVVLVSGIYELEPLVGTTVNDALKFDALSARAQSPVLQTLQGFPQAIVCWGEIETVQFKRQSASFAQALKAAGGAAESFEIARRNHFDVIMELTDHSTRLGQRTLALLEP